MKNAALVILTVINILIASCGKNEALAEKNFQQVRLFDHDCITNGKALWCSDR